MYHSGNYYNGGIIMVCDEFFLQILYAIAYAKSFKDLFLHLYLLITKG